MLRKRIFSTLFTALIVLFVGVTQTYAQTADWVAGDGVSTPKCVTDENVATIQGIECLIGNVLAVAITLIGLAAFVMFLIGSFKYLTAGSNTKGVESGKNAISFAILGIVVALASFVLLRFVTGFTGVTSILEFNTQLPQP